MKGKGVLSLLFKVVSVDLTYLTLFNTKKKQKKKTGICDRIKHVRIIQQKLPTDQKYAYIFSDDDTLLPMIIEYKSELCKNKDCVLFYIYIHMCTKIAGIFGEGKIETSNKESYSKCH